ncbi:MAG: biotin/lipoyl-containing protein [Ilumatobacteraceae bacterium]
MIERVILPRLGDTVDEVVVVEWLVAVGSLVKKGDSLMRVETDKVDVDVESPFAGVVSELLVAQGDEVKTGTVLCTITPQA